MKKIVLTFMMQLAFVGITAQDLNLNCNTKEANDLHFQQYPAALKEHEQFNEYTINFVNNLNQNRAKQLATYTIPVVVHVYGTVQGGDTVEYQTIVNSLTQVNDEFQGLNADYNTVDPEFLNIRGTIDVEFKLAKIDPDGNCTDGVIFHPVASGHGNYSSPEVANDGWDNYKYVNVYITNDLYADGVTNNSGVAWYPSTNMSNADIARIVYNGSYLTGNTNSEFASVLTHEFGHFFNLFHTHEGGCANGDQVADTPAENEGGGNCAQIVECNNNVNYENYMGYKGSSGCNKMFTQGQMDRVLATMSHPARQSLWQPSNLIATGVNSSCALSLEDETFENSVTIYPNPINDSFNILSDNFVGENVFVTIYSILGRRIYKKEYVNVTRTLTIENAIKAPGYYIVQVLLKNGRQVNIPIKK